MKDFIQYEQEKLEDNHLYAHSIKDNRTIYIGEAESGRKGYLCLGCKMEMQAVIRHIAGYQSYFRHDPKNIKVERKCTYSDETYRHILAKQNIQRLKRVKVLAIYKYPPKGEEGEAILIKDSHFIEAYSVGIEKCFFEDSNGKIQQGKGNEFETEAYFRPDAVFFDKEGNPILFIELVATHKISDEKKALIKRFGIDTIQIIIPRDSPEAIEKVFSVTTNTKWIYNYEQENTPYISVPDGNGKGILSVDELQRKLFEESFRCRKARIANLIRGFNLCISSQQYTELEKNFRGEIRRINKLTEEFEHEERELQKGIRAECNQRIAERREHLRGEKEDVRKAEDEFYGSFSNEVEKELGIGKDSLRRRRESMEDKNRKLEGRYISKRNIVTGKIINRSGKIKDIGNEQERIISEINKIEYDIRRIQAEIGELPYNETKENEYFEFEWREKERIEGEIRKIQIDDEEFGRIVESRVFDIRKEVDTKIEAEERRFTEAISTGIAPKDDEYTGKFTKLVEDMALYDGWRTMESENRRYREAIEIIRKRTYKNWHE